MRLITTSWFCVDGDTGRAYFTVLGAKQVWGVEWSEHGGAWWWVPKSPLLLAHAAECEEWMRYAVVPVCPATDGQGVHGGVAQREVRTRVVDE